MTGGSDLWIAATALEAKDALVTAKPGHFREIRGPTVLTH